MRDQTAGALDELLGPAPPCDSFLKVRPRRAATTGSVLSTCDAVQHALIAGEPTHLLTPHLRSCADCALLVEALGHLRPPADAPTRVEPQALLQAMVDGLVDGKRILGRYLIQHQLGAGGEGWVYAALDTETNQQVAIKFGSSDALPGFVNAQTVVHESVCPVHYTTVVAGVRIVVMRFAAGGSLADLVGRLDLHEALPLIRGVCAGLEAVHAAGLVHLDVKAANVLIDDGRPLLVDFGLSTRAGTACIAGRGTQGFMPPEQQAGKVVTPAADVYALARLCQSLLRGSPPRRLQALLRRATDEDPGRRPSGAAAFWRELEAAARPHRGRWLTAVLALPVLAALVWAGWPTAGARADWSTELWSLDTVPASHWNVAANRRGGRLPAVEANLPAVGCARNLGELLDGLAAYQDVQHGYAFPGGRATCLPMDHLQDCGALDTNAARCLLGAADAQPLARVPGAGARLGQYQPASTCNDEFALTVTLARTYRVGAVRAWFREGVPERLRVEVQSEHGIWRTAYATRENRRWVAERRRLPREGVGSVPVTIQFPPASTRKVRLLLRCRPPATDGFGSQAAEPVWLYEVEVFAAVGWAEAWARRWGMEGR